MNKVFLIGRITKDLELRKTQKGTPVCEFSLAVKRDKDNTDFINCVIWNKQAENLVKYQSKGSLISIIGELRADSFEVNGEKRYKTYVLVNQVEYLSSKQNTPQKEVKEANNPYQDFGDSIKTLSDFGTQVEITDEDLPW